jgi:hypothetical protein
VTGGEDSKINIWSCPPFTSFTSQVEQFDDDLMDVDKDVISHKRQRDGGGIYDNNTSEKVRPCLPFRGMQT